MQIKIFVVMTEIKPKNPIKAIKQFKKNRTTLRQINDIKTELIKTFYGITEYKNLNGFWLNENKLFLDSVNIWEILTDKLSNEQKTQLKAVNEKLKAITQQKSQLYTINNKSIFL